MSFTIRRVIETASFLFLKNATRADNGKVLTLFGMTACFHVYDALTTFSTDLTIDVPDMPGLPIEYGFILTEKGKRMFCYVVVRKEADYRAVNVFEVTPFTLLMPARGLRSVSDAGDTKFSSRTFPMVPLMEVMAPDDGQPIDYVCIDCERNAYYGLREGVPDTAPWAVKDVPSQSQFGNTPKPPPKLAPIYFELGADCFHAMRINGDAALMELSKSGGLLND
jgi:hypothetical protein